MDDATASNLFSEDAYVRERRPKSVLCVPVIKQTKLVGALYLENNLTPNAFTPQRIAVLEFLASQAAISLENAYLYADLVRSEAFLSEGQRISHTGSWSWTLSTGKVVWSEEHRRIFGHDPEQEGPPDSSCFWQASPGRPRVCPAGARHRHSRPCGICVRFPDRAPGRTGQICSRRRPADRKGVRQD